MRNVDIFPLFESHSGHLFSVRKSLGIPFTIIQRYHPGTLISFAMENPRKLFSRVLKTDKGAF